MNARRKFVSTFRRDRLPEPVHYYESEGLTLIGRGAWRSALCPFHEDRRPSLRINVESGAWRCMACGAHGSGIVDFEMRRYGATFRQAAERLGAWEIK